MLIYIDFECLLVEQQSCQNNPNDSYTERKAIHEACGYSIDLVISFVLKQDRHSYYRRRDYSKRFCEYFKKHAIKIINFKEKETIPLTDKEIIYEKQKLCHICKKKFYYNKNEKNKFKIYQKVKDHCHYTGKFRGTVHSICNLRYKVQREIPVKIHNGSKYDFHFLIKELAEESI